MRLLAPVFLLPATAMSYAYIMIPSETCSTTGPYHIVEGLKEVHYNNVDHNNKNKNKNTKTGKTKFSRDLVISELL